VNELKIVCDRCGASAGGWDERHGWMQFLCEDCGSGEVVCADCYGDLGDGKHALLDRPLSGGTPSYKLEEFGTHDDPDCGIGDYVKLSFSRSVANDWR
jgi:hypothetical protein